MTLSYTDTAGLPPSTAVSYTIAAVNQFGEGLPSLPASATTLPATPLQPTVQAQTVNSSSIALTWNNVGGTSYLITRNGGNTRTISGLSFTDTGLSPATPYTYSIAGINPSGQGPAGMATGTTSASPSTSGYKFSPGHYFNSQILGNLTNNLALVKAEIDELAAHSAGTTGYVMNPSWGDIEGSTQGVYPGLVANTGILDTIWLYLQSKIPGMRMGISFTGYQIITLTVAQANVRDFSGNTVPAYIANCGGTLNVTGPYGAGSYTLALQGNGTQYGFAIYNWNGSAYKFAIPLYCDPGVNACWINMMLATLAHVLPAAGPYVAAALNPHSGIEFVMRNDEYTIDFTSGPNTGAAHGTYNPPNSTGSSNSPSAANFYTQFKLWAQKITAAAPNTMIPGCIGYGVTASAGTDGPTGVYSHVQDMASVRGYVLTGADTTPTQFLNAPPNIRPSASWAQQAYRGITHPVTAPTTLPSLTGNATDQLGKMPNFAQVEPFDYLAKYSTVNQSDVPQNILDIITAGNLMGASHFLWWCGGSTETLSLWHTVIQKTFITVPPPRQTLPTNLAASAPPVSNANTLGVNLAGFNYSSGSIPYMNLMVMGGQQSGNYNWCGWLTGNGVASGSTNEQALVNFDTDQYPLQIPQAGLTSSTVYTILSNRSIAPGATTAYRSGVWRLQYTGPGTVVVSGGDVSSTVTLTNAGTGTVSSNVTLSGAGNITYLTITHSDPSSIGQHVRAISLVHSSNTAAFDAGAIFDPLFLSAIDPFSSLRFMDWLQTNNEFESHNASGNTIAAGATSCVLSSSTQLPNQTGKLVYFNDGTIRTTSVTTTGGVTTLNWSAGGGGLPNTITTSRGNLARSNLYFSSHDNWSKRPLPSNAFYCMNGGVPYEVALALCNAVNADMELPVSMAAPDSYITSLFQLIHAGTGAQIGGGLSTSQRLLPELSNEVWNSAFTQYEVAGYFGGGQWPSQPPGGGNATWTGQWHGMRTAVMAELAKSAYGADFARCVPVLGSQASNLGTVQDRLQTSYWTAPIDGYTGPASAHPISAVAIAPYFGQFTLSTADTTTMLGVSVPLDDFFATLSSQTGTSANGSKFYSSVPSGGWLNQAAGWSTTYKTYLTANYAALKLIMYEGGQQFGAGTSAWNALLVTANRDTRMGTAYTTYLKAWATNIGSTSANIIHLFNDCWAEQSNGFCWGLYESPMQNIAVSPPPKYAAAIAFITG